MKNRISSLWASYQTTLVIAGDKSAELNKSFLAYIISYVFQGVAYALFYPLLTAIFADPFRMHDALWWFAMITGVAAFSIGFRWYALDFSFSETLTQVTHDLRIKLGHNIRTMPLQRLNQYRTGELNHVLVQSVDESVLHMGAIAGMAFEAFVIPVTILIAMFFIDPAMAMAIMLALPLSYPVYQWFRRLARKEKEENQAAHALLEADTVEYIQGLAVLRAVNQVGANSVRLQEAIARVRKVQLQGVTGSLIPMIVMNTLIEFVFLMVLSLGALWIVGGSFTIAGLVALLIIINRLAEPLANFLALSSVLDVMELGFAQIKKLSEIQRLTVTEPEEKPTTYGIRFDNVSFNYTGHDNTALNQVSADIPSNALTAIVGASGSGKTTITKMIMRYDDPCQGCITIGGVDIRRMSQENLMGLISVVFQDVYLFDDTVLNNIRMGNPEASDEAVKAAAEKAHCHDFILRLPDGYDTRVGETGGSLSGGERQRISIARAILKDAPIVILDEPTSSLDTESEVAVQAALDELIRNRTVIVIAHRLSTIAHADNILVLSEGEICERGMHDNLLQSEGRYAAMFAAQQRLKQWNLSYE